MRKLTFFIVQACLVLRATCATAQTITLSVSNVPLDTVFSKIQQQSPYRFVYTSEELQGTKKVSFSVQKVPIQVVLGLSFKGQPVDYSIEEKYIFVRKKERGNDLPDSTLTASGIVLNDKKEPQEGLTVSVKGIGKATSTDATGFFTLHNVSLHVVLVISGVNTETTEIKWEGQPNLVVLIHSKITGLPDAAVTVSTGYQEIPRERATGSFATVNNQLFNQQVSPDVLSRLESITNGLSVFRNSATNTTQIMIRGLSTINGPTSPLIVVDNFPYEGDITNIQPGDVDQITVLKDAAATSIWGTRAGNGVIVITTKKGNFNQRLKIELNTNLLVGQKPNLHYLTPMTSSDYIGMEQFLYGQGFYVSQLNSPLFPVVSPVVELLTQESNGTVPAAQVDQQLAAWKQNDVRNDFRRYIYQPMVNQQYALTLRGGDADLAYLFSGGLDKDVSTLAVNFHKINVRTQADYKPLKNLHVSMQFYYTQSENSSGKPAYGSISPLAPYQQLADARGNPLAIPQTYRQAFKDTAGGGNLLDWNYYPLTDYQHSRTTTNLQDVWGTLGLQYQITRAINVEVKYQYEKQVSTASTDYDLQSYYARNLINSFSELGNGTVTYIVPDGGILDQTQGGLESYDWRGQVNVDRSWNKHQLTALAGEEIRQTVNTTSAVRNYGYDNDILISSPVDYITPYPNYVTQIYSTVPYLNGFTRTLNRNVSFYSNAAYTFNGTYTVSGSLRRDASNLFGVQTNNKWTPLWSGGLAWNIHKEKFYRVPSIPYLKLRMTYGLSGNVDPNVSALTTLSYSGVSPYTGTPYSMVSNYANPSLRWEKVATANIGVDFKSLHNRLYGSIEYYHKNATDLYGTVPVDYTTGLGSPTVTKNVASLQGHGMDIELNTVNIDQRLKWVTTLNFNTYRDKVTNYYLDASSGNYFVNNAQVAVQGYPVWSVFSYRSAGLDPTNGNPRGYLNKQISEDYAALTGTGTTVGDLVFNGPRFPVVYGSMGNTLSYRRFSCSIRILYQMGNYFRKQSINYADLFMTGIGNADYAKRWQQPGDEKKTSVPSFPYPLDVNREAFYTGSQVLIEKADNIRLQYISLSYSIPDKSSGGHVTHIEWYLNANNLGLLWRANKQGIDPDYTQTNTFMPAPRNLAIGLRATF